MPPVSPLEKKIKTCILRRKPLSQAAKSESMAHTESVPTNCAVRGYSPSCPQHAALQKRGRAILNLVKTVLTVIAALALALPTLTSAQTTCLSLSLGSTGASVTAVQKILHAAYANFPTPTGYFGPLTEAAVKQWQKERGIEQTGTVGPKTSAAMKLCTAAVVFIPQTPPPVSGVSTAQNSSPFTPPQSAAQTGSPATPASFIETLLAQIAALQDQIAALKSGNTTAQTQTPSTQPHACPTITPPFASCTGSLLPLTDARGCTTSYQCSVSPQTQTNQPTTQTTQAIQATQITTPAACSWNGQSIASGARVTAYQSSSVSSGQTCASESRLCTNGTFSGSYTAASCAVSPAASCTFNGSTVASGASVTAYQAGAVAAGQTCQSQQRTCTNGTLSGTYSSGSCAVNTSAL